MSDIQVVLDEYIENTRKKEQLKLRIGELNTEQKALQIRILTYMQEEKKSTLDYGEFNVSSYINVKICKTKKRKRLDENEDPNSHQS